MPEPRSDLISRTDRPPGMPDGSPPSLPGVANGAISDNTPTVISKNVVRPATAEEALRSLRGRRLAHFELLEAIGVGGMAAVLRARDTQLDRIVALKILPPEMANDSENVHRFHQEARSAAKLDHENIARVFFCGEDQRLHFIAFEFVEGENLRTILERRGRLPVGETLHYMLQVAAGLAHAAARGVVHRDIKPSNIIITPSGRAKVVDMGLARCLEGRPDKGLTHSGVTLGTFDYISPEQALEPRDADVRSDIYSLGCTFYHMLTGQTPVPEGTAAKKLHHHQHIKPTDPRELAPNIPDEVAMILARMMAKNPRDRYQTPEQLVHDLLRAARKLGGGGDVPEGVLAVEASLPHASSYRPLLLIGAAAAAVVVLILLLAPSVTPTPHKEVAHVEPVKDGGGNTSTANSDTSRTVPPDDGGGHNAKQDFVFDRDEFSVADLVHWLKDHENAEKIEVQLARDLDLQGSDDAELRLLFRAKREVVIHPKKGNPKNPKWRPTIHLAYSLNKLSPRAALTIDCKEATVEGIRVVVDGIKAREAMTGLLFQGHSGGSYRVERCEFTQVWPEGSDDQQRLSSVVLDTQSLVLDSPRLALHECAFLGFDKLQTEKDLRDGTSALLLQDPSRGGQDAVVRRGPGHLKADNCAFGPHAETFRFEGGSDVATVSHCTFMAGRKSATFCLHDDRGTQLDIRYSLFARAGQSEAVGDRDSAFLVSQTDPRSPAIYNGIDNRYYHLDGYWSGEQRAETVYADFVRKLRDKETPGDLTGDDKYSRVLNESPWANESPLKQLEEIRYFDATTKLPVSAPEYEELLKGAFEVNRNLRDLRRGDELNKSLIGLEHLGRAIDYAAYLPKLEEKKPEPKLQRTLTVDPMVAMSEKGTYPSLSQAIGDAQPGDLIVIHHTGALRVDAIRLEKPSIDLTIRPDTDCHPILEMGDTTDPHKALFRLHDGKLRLENLDFRLQPAEGRLKSQCVVTMIGEGQCVFKNCVLTLDQGNRDNPLIPLAVATLVDNGDVMKMKTQPGAVSQDPRLEFDNCFVRGNGDLLWSRVSRPLVLDLTNSLVALSGNVFNVEVPESAAAPESEAVVRVTINHTTTYVAGNFMRLKVGKEDLKGLVPLHCKATKSLFVAAPMPQAFIYLDGPEVTEDTLKVKLPWTSEENAYVGYNTMFIQPMHEDPPQKGPRDQMGWRQFTGDKMSQFPAMVDFTTSPSDSPFVRLTPDMFKLAESTMGKQIKAGADVQKMPRSEDR